MKIFPALFLLFATVPVILAAEDIQLHPFQNANSKVLQAIKYEQEVRSDYGPWIVQLHRGGVDHETYVASARKVHESYRESAQSSKVHEEALSMGFEVTHTYKRALNGVVIKGVTKEHLSLLEGVKHISYDGKVFASQLDFWGQDRIDQESLPLDDAAYDPAFVGAGVDVYVLDTGLDTTHDDFTTGLNPNVNRTVANVYDAYSNTLSDDNDVQGHGTHCAGTVGGYYSGVAKGANIYGVKVLDDDGSGAWSTIVDAMEWVLDNREPDHPSVLSMSLGGACEDQDCKDDILIEAVENVVDEGLVVVVAAGNEGCNSRVATPAAAPRAITVGATDRNDNPAYFSNFGEYIDIFAPGDDIVSACGSISELDDCSGGIWYIALSGTSMACPHVAGAVAQLFQKNASATPDDILSALLCDSAKQQVSLEGSDTITRNLLLQVPQNNGDFGTCSLGVGCDSLADCSGHGYCAPAHYSSSYGSTDSICFCDGEYGGPACEMSKQDYREELCDTGLEVTLVMTSGADDTYGYGWEWSNFAIYNSTGDASTASKLIVDHAMDGYCQSSYPDVYNLRRRKYCLPVGCYTVDTSSSLAGAAYDEDNGWSICGVSGAGNDIGTFCVYRDPTADTHRLVCQEKDEEGYKADDDEKDYHSTTELIIVLVSAIGSVVFIFTVAVFYFYFIHNKDRDVAVAPSGELAANTSLRSVYKSEGGHAADTPGGVSPDAPIAGAGTGGGRVAADGTAGGSAALYGGYDTAVPKDSTAAGADPAATAGSGAAGGGGAASEGALADFDDAQGTAVV